MTPHDSSGGVRSDWVDRQRQHGKQPRAVLMKGLHGSINALIDAWHRRLMHLAFAAPENSARPGPVLDVGCGYGRLADEAARFGMQPVVGLDFAPGFCADFNRDHGPAVCGDLARLPFRDAAFSDAYSVTSLMYLPFDQAQATVRDIDRCLAPGGRVLLVEPGREFNAMVRTVLRRKRDETLAMPGFSRAEFTTGLAPPNWQLEAGGGCSAITWLLPLLMVAAPFPAVFRPLAGATLRLDSPCPGARRKAGRFSMYRWAVYRKTGGVIEDDRAS